MLSKVVSQKNTLILFALLLIQAIAYNYHEYIMMEPRSIHSWRQSDCLTFALNFYNDRGSFTEPCVNNLGSTNTGKVASDFPIIQYLVGKIWKVTGIQTFIFRIVDLFFLFFGLVFTFKLFRRWFKNGSTLAILFTGIIFTSPILSYYGPTSLSDIQALGLSCSAFYFFIVWLEQENNFKYKPLFISVSLFTLAGLLKMSAVFTMLLAISYLISRLLINKSEYKKYLSIKTILAIVLPFIPWFLWYSHAKHYNELNPNGFFLVGILPIWELDMQKIQSIFSMLINEIIPQIIHPYILFSIVGLSAILFISNLRKKKISQALEIIFPYLIFSTYVVLCTCWGYHQAITGTLSRVKDR